MYFTQEYDVEFIDIYSGEHLTLGPNTFQLDAPGPDEKSKGEWNPGMLSKADKEKFGIEEIPRDNFLKRAQELGVPQDTIEQLLKTDESTFYFAHNCPVIQIK